MKLEHAVVEQVVPGKFRGNKADSQIVGDGRGDQVVGRNFDARAQIQPLFLKEIVPKKPRRCAGLHADKWVHTKLFERECAVLQLGKTVSGNAVAELLAGGREIEHVLVANGERTGSIVPLVAKCKKQGVVVKYVDRRKLDAMCNHANHQGIVAVASAHDYVPLETILDRAEEKGEAPFLVLCDGIEDGHNLGAIIRSAEAGGAHGVVIPKRRSVGLNYTVAKTACGALEYLPVARVSNLNQTIELLKKRGVWVYAADMDGTPWCQTNFDGGVALVIGSEGSGVSALVKKNCDAVVSLPMQGKVNSLNASVAAGILIYEVTRQRLGLIGK